MSDVAELSQMLCDFFSSEFESRRTKTHITLLFSLEAERRWFYHRIAAKIWFQYVWNKPRMHCTYARHLWRKQKRSENRILPCHSPASKNTILLRQKDTFPFESSFKGENGPDSYPGLSWFLVSLHRFGDGVFHFGRASLMLHLNRTCLTCFSRSSLSPLSTPQ